MCGIILLKLLLILICAAIGLSLISLWFFRDQRNPDEIHYVRTSDGRVLALRRIRPKAKPVRKTPVILQHGLGANHRNLDLDDERSVALYLARQGYDCFTPDLRGVGLSQDKRWGAPGKWDIEFDDFVEKDQPAIFDKVLQLT
ncbi:MAG: alpha/beta hydrolase, partial [Alphaproteobacteria bacterium]